MAVWYEVLHSKKDIYNFMECNWHFHDFRIERVSYIPDSNTAELFLKYDELEGSVVLRFVGVISMSVNIQVEFGYVNDIMGSVLLLTEKGQFIWIADDSWGDQSVEHIEELKKNSSWIESERLIWATTDKDGIPTELPVDKIDQTWNIYGKIKHRHFDLTPCKDFK